MTDLPIRGSRSSVWRLHTSQRSTDCHRYTLVRGPDIGKNRKLHPTAPGGIGRVLQVNADPFSVAVATHPKYRLPSAARLLAQLSACLPCAQVFGQAVCGRKPPYAPRSGSSVDCAFRGQIQFRPVARRYLFADGESEGDDTSQIGRDPATEGKIEPASAAMNGTSLRFQ